jgi:hypothetical protein
MLERFILAALLKSEKIFLYNLNRLRVKPQVNIRRRDLVL